MWFSSHEHILNGYSGFEKFYPIFKRGIFLDTAPLFILVCGNFDKKNHTHLIENFNANLSKKGEDKQYKLYDYNCLIAFLNSLDLKQIPLLITPHIFTEFIKCLWEICKNPRQFRDVLETAFKPRTYIKDIQTCLLCNSFLCDEDLLNKKLEIGDISILICAKEERKKMGATTILTNDTSFAEVSDKKHDFLTIFYNEIRTSTLQLGIANIPEEYLKDI